MSNEREKLMAHAMTSAVTARRAAVHYVPFKTSNSGTSAHQTKNEHNREFALTKKQPTCSPASIITVRISAVIS